MTLAASQFTGTKSPRAADAEGHPAAPAGQGRAAPAQRRRACRSGQPSTAVSRTRRRRPGPGSPFPPIVFILLKYAGTPLLVLAAAGAALIALKAARRRGRRSAGPPSARVAGAWRELVDLGRDLGIAAAGTAPRRDPQGVRRGRRRTGPDRSEGRRGSGRRGRVRPGGPGRRGRGRDLAACHGGQARGDVSLPLRRAAVGRGQPGEPVGIPRHPGTPP